jgi:hypothetical protein
MDKVQQGELIVRTDPLALGAIKDMAGAIRQRNVEELVRGDESAATNRGAIGALDELLSDIEECVAQFKKSKEE